MRRFAILVVLSIGLAGCAGQSIFQGGPSLTATVNNPVGRNELAAIESGYAIALTAALAVRRLPMCKRGQEPTFSAVCVKRSVLVALQAYDRAAHAAIVTARRFVRDNPTLNAFSVLAAARQAVEDFRSAAQSAGA